MVAKQPARNTRRRMRGSRRAANYLLYRILLGLCTGCFLALCVRVTLRTQKRGGAVTENGRWWAGHKRCLNEVEKDEVETQSRQDGFSRQMVAPLRSGNII